MKAKDIRVPHRRILYDGHEYDIVFNNEALFLIEDVYENEYKTPLGVFDILQRLTQGRYRAVVACVYAALRAGGCDAAFPEFLEKFRITNIMKLQTEVMRAVTDALPENTKKTEPTEEA